MESLPPRWRAFCYLEAEEVDQQDDRERRNCCHPRWCEDRPFFLFVSQFHEHGVQVGLDALVQPLDQLDLLLRPPHEKPDSDT